MTISGTTAVFTSLIPECQAKCALQVSYSIARTKTYCSFVLLNPLFS